MCFGTGGERAAVAASHNALNALKLGRGGSELGPASQAGRDRRFGEKLRKQWRLRRKCLLRRASRPRALAQRGACAGGGWHSSEAALEQVPGEVSTARRRPSPSPEPSRAAAGGSARGAAGPARAARRRCGAGRGCPRTAPARSRARSRSLSRSRAVSAAQDPLPRPGSRRSGPRAFTASDAAAAACPGLPPRRRGCPRSTRLFLANVAPVAAGSPPCCVCADGRDTAPGTWLRRFVRCQQLREAWQDSRELSPWEANRVPLLMRC